MPLLEIQIVGEPQVDNRNALTRDLADAAAEVFGAGPRSTWVRLSVLPPRAYAENGGAAAGVKPVLVSLVKKTNPERAGQADEVRRLTEAVAEICRRPAENVHVRYEPPGEGRVAFGGELV